MIWYYDIIWWVFRYGSIWWNVCNYCIDVLILFNCKIISNDIFIIHHTLDSGNGFMHHDKSGNQLLDRDDRWSLLSGPHVAVQLGEFLQKEISYGNLTQLWTIAICRPFTYQKWRFSIATSMLNYRALLDKPKSNCLSSLWFSLLCSIISTWNCTSDTII